MKKKITCFVMGHKWTRRTTRNGYSYVWCERCGEQKTTLKKIIKKKGVHANSQHN